MAFNVLARCPALYATLVVLLAASITADQSCFDPLSCKYCATGLDPHIACSAQNATFDDLDANTSLEPGYAESNMSNLVVATPGANRTRFPGPGVLASSAPNFAYVPAGQAATLSFSSVADSYPYGNLKRFDYACTSSTPAASGGQQQLPPAACTVTVTAYCLNDTAFRPTYPLSVYRAAFAFEGATAAQRRAGAMVPMRAADFAGGAAAVAARPAGTDEFCERYVFSAKGAAGAPAVRMLLDNVVFALYYPI